jgi:hypothetical protein
VLAAGGLTSLAERLRVGLEAYKSM